MDRLTPRMFGAKGDGISDDTVPLAQWWRRAFDLDVAPVLERGRYVIQPGRVVYEAPTGSRVHFHGPDLHVEPGAVLVVDRRLPDIPAHNAPLLTLHGPPEGGRIIKDGTLNRLTFEDQTTHVAAERHGLSLRGIQEWQFGAIRGEGLRGSLVHIPRAVHDGFNPDPFHVGLCHFRTLEHNRGSGPAIGNDNNVGLNGCGFGSVRSGGGRLAGGILRTAGAGNNYGIVTTSTTRGWAADFYNSGGSVSRDTWLGAELDNPEYGIRIQAQLDMKLENARIVCGYQDGIGYWPRIPLQIGGGRLIRNVLVRLRIRIDPPKPGVKGPTGEPPSAADFAPALVDLCGDPNLVDVHVDLQVTDNSGLGIGTTVSNYVRNAKNARVTIDRDGKRVLG
jgi:hypothetical protein